MIKINLAARKKALDAGNRSGGGTGVGAQFDLATLLGYFNQAGAQGGALKELPIRKVAVPLVVAALASFLLDNYKEEEVAKLTAKIVAINAEKPALLAEAAKLKNHEELKKSLEGDEFTIRTKIETIQKLIKGRMISPKLLTALATAVPVEVWLTDFRVQGDNISLTGSSGEFTQISDFMKSLGESAYYLDLNLRSTQQTKDEGGYDVASFEMTAKRAQP